MSQGLTSIKSYRSTDTGRGRPSLDRVWRGHTEQHHRQRGTGELPGHHKYERGNNNKQVEL